MGSEPTRSRRIGTTRQRRVFLVALILGVASIGAWASSGRDSAGNLFSQPSPARSAGSDSAWHGAWRTSLTTAAIPQEAAACSAPYTTPSYVRPADDSVALGTLIEGAGYGASSNSDWTGIASGNFCGGAEKELALLKNTHSNMSMMRGPAPYAVGAFDLESDAAQPWKTVAAGNLDGGAFDELVAVRKVASATAPDIVVMKVDPASCASGRVVASAAIGNPSNSDWIAAAVGNFDGAGKQLALLKSAHSNFFLAKLTGSTLTPTFSADLDTNAAYPWKGIAAGDLDGDGIDELVAVRSVSDGRGATVLVYKWKDQTFQIAATSTFGNTGNSSWTGVTVGDFNADGRAAIAVVKNEHSNFAILDLPAAAGTLRVIAASDLDSASGQGWRGVTAADWLAGDQNAAELVAVRAARDPYRADLFVYGNGFHRVQRDSGLEGNRSEYDQPRGTSPADLIASLADAHATTINWSLVIRPQRDPSGKPTYAGDYDALVDFLIASKGACIDGRQLRVQVTLVPKRAVRLPDGGNINDPQQVQGVPCSWPDDNPQTTWHELDYFAPANGDVFAQCKDTMGWASVIGRLAQDYPQIVSLGIDDFSHHPDDYPGEELAEVQSRMRQQAPWLSFVPTAYHGDLNSIPPDLARTFDTFLYYFRNEKVGPQCLSDPCGTNSVGNAPGEYADAVAVLPAGRRLQVGTYWDALYDREPPENASNRYDYDLVRLTRSLPWIGGVTAYPAISRTPGLVCNEFNMLDNDFCTLQRVFGSRPPAYTDTDLTSASGAILAAGNPFTYVFASHGVQNIVYRATDGHVHELWRAGGGIGHSDLSALGHAPGAQGDPMAYVVAAQDVQNVVYRGTDNQIHGLYWSQGAVGHDVLTTLAHAPAAAGAPFGYMFDAIGFQNVLYRGSDGHLHGLWWSTGAVGHDDLTTLTHASPPAGDPYGYVFPALGVQNALYRGTDSHLHGLYWSTGAVGHDDLTLLSGAPAPANAAVAYIAPNYGTQHAVYRGTDGHAHELYWSTGPVGHDDLTNDSHAPVPNGDPAAYFVAGDGTHHVIYRSADNHLRALSWTTGFVTHDDLTLLTSAGAAAGNPSGYVAPDGLQHVVYRSADGHLHDITIRN
jgi:hypothetical protein